MAENHAGTDTGTDTVRTVESDAADDARTNPAPAEKRASTLSRLYTGTGAFDIVGRRRLFYAIVGATLLIAIGSMLFRGFVFGIEFEGGTQLQFPAGSATVTQVEDTYRGALGQDPVTVQTVGTGSSTTVQIRSETLSQDQVGTLKQALLDRFQPVAASGQPSIDAISDSAVSETWGGEITQKALVALVVFLVLVSLFIGFRYERDMAIAALAALVHDLVLTAGIYSLVGFEVTPATVIGLLTILGFSLYDTVVVFDKVQENTRGVFSLTRRTYAEQANLAINQTLMRSLNTTVIAVLPVLGLLAVGVGLLGVGTLKDLALVQLACSPSAIQGSAQHALPESLCCLQVSAESCTHAACHRFHQQLGQRAWSPSAIQQSTRHALSESVLVAGTCRAVHPCSALAQATPPTAGGAHIVI